MKLGSEEHKKLFCRNFMDTYLDYEPEKMPWPDLDSVSLEKLQGIPFWREALITETEAGFMVEAFAKTIEDPLIKEAIELQADEETRHGRLIRFLIDRYEVKIQDPPPVELPKNIENDFINFGFSECLDSFFAFGMFDIAHQAQYLPEPMFEIFNPILDEEARHIVFFVNWFTYLQINRGQGLAPVRSIRTIWHYGKALQKLASAFGNSTEDTDEDRKPFTASEATHFMDNLTPELFFSTCLQENKKRMSKYDDRLLKPQLMPALSQFAYNALKIWPGNKQPATSAPLGN